MASKWTRAKSLWERVGPRARDLGFVVIALSASVVKTFARHDEAPVIRLLTLLVGLVGAVALWWRRRAPATVTGLGVVVLLITQVGVTMAIGLFSLAVRRRDRVLAVMIGLNVATLAVVHEINGSDGWIGSIALGLIEAGFWAAAGSYIGARRDLLVSLRERALRAEEERDLRAEQSKLAERARIAREMHDVVAHKVSLIALHAGALEVSTTAASPQIRQTAELIRATAREAMEDLRGVLGVLRAGVDIDDDGLAPQPRSADIERVVEASRAAEVRAELTMGVTDLPDAIGRAAYRVVQEGLTNVHKHARGAATSVTVVGDALNGVTVEVVNQRPVASGTLLPGSGVGLLGLRERITLLGGSLGYGPCIQGGWRLTAWLPWPADGARAVPGGAP